MEFKGQYLTYQEYKGLGGTLGLTPFNILEFEARKQIDIRTQSRLKNSNLIPDEVKMCVYKLINSIENYTKTIDSNSNIASENIDGYSVTYITADKISEIVKSKSTEIEDIIRSYLLYVVVNKEHLMYCGA